MEQKLLGKRRPLEQRGAGCHKSTGSERRAAWRPFCLPFSLTLDTSLLKSALILAGFAPQRSLDSPVVRRMALCAGGRTWG